jgi:hypothetical protein
MEEDNINRTTVELLSIYQLATTFAGLTSADKLIKSSLILLAIHLVGEKLGES